MTGVQKCALPISVLILLIIALITLISAMINYILLSLCEIVKGGKKVAVMKCFGASNTDIFYRFLVNAVTNVSISVALTFILIFSLKNNVQNLIGENINSLFNITSLSVIAIIRLVVKLLIALIPNKFYKKIPVASDFRGARCSNNFIWKNSLLFIKYTTSSLFVHS